ncbi:MAG: TlpA disulfide reductase family protein [Thiohalocapsa sp.]
MWGIALAIMVAQATAQGPVAPAHNPQPVSPTKPPVSGQPSAEAEASAEAIPDQTLEVQDAEGNTLLVKILGAGGSPRLLWPNTLDDGPPGVARTKARLLAAGFELWLADPLEARFLPHSNEQIRTLPGTTITALIRAAGNHASTPTLLLAHGRMALPVLRGIHHWQREGTRGARLDGVVLLYPNLFGPTPAAGDEPTLDPIVAASNWPLLIVQPERGALRWSLAPVLSRLWDNDASAFALLVPEVRDWYLFHEPGKDPLEDAATARLPAQLRNAARLFAQLPLPSAPPQLVASTHAEARVTGMRQRPGTTLAPEFALRDADGLAHAMADYRGSVTLVNFWASWCPPCVEEIPSMNRLAAGYDAADFRIVSVNFQESPETIRGFMQQVDVDFPVLLDLNGAVSRDWSVFAFPSSFLVDRSGRVRYSVNSAIAWDEPAVIETIDALVAE